LCFVHIYVFSVPANLSQEELNYLHQSYTNSIFGFKSFFGSVETLIPTLYYPFYGP